MPARSMDERVNPITEDISPMVVPQRPPPVVSAESSRAPSYRGTTACDSPRSGSFDEKSRDIKNIKTNVLPLPSFSCESFETVHGDSDYDVVRLHKYDDIDLMAQWKKTLFRFAPVTTFGAVGSYILYFVFRIYCTRKSGVVYHKTFWLAWFFIVAEALVSMPTLLHQAWLILSVRGRKRPQLRILGPIVPTVDVFLTCCKEDVDVILDTVRGACGIDYPQDRFRVVVLDDGQDIELKKAVENLRAVQFPNLFYHARVKTKPHHAKAGNLIGGTDLVTRLEGGAGEFIAALDADMIPEPSWLRAIMAHAVNDPKVALVCPPQLFYNIPHGDLLAQSLDAFVHIVEPSKDATGVAWCTGSGYCIRRAALMDIGGWPLGSLAEDVCTSSMLLGRGWKTVYVHEALQFGEVPDSFTGHLKQRTRWTLGTLQTAVKLNWFLWGKDIKQMGFFARLSGIVFSMDALFKMFMLISMVTIPVVLFSGGTLVAYTTTNELRWQIRLCTISLLLTMINMLVSQLPAGYRLGRQEGAATIWMAPYHAITVLRSFILPYWLGGKTMSFSSSGSIKGALEERDPARRAPLYRRLKVVLIDCGAIVHVLFAALTIGAVVYSCVLAFEKHGKWARLQYLLTHAGWPPMLWAPMINSAIIPLRYALWPPSMPDREELLVRDPKTGIAHPKAEWKNQRWNVTSHFQEALYTLATLYTIILFIGTFTFQFINHSQST